MALGAFCSFHANFDSVTRCIFRIKNKQPVGEFEDVALIGNDRKNDKFGPDDVHAYSLIIQYLDDFLG
jgi:hypothetical protein